MYDSRLPHLVAQAAPARAPAQAAARSVRLPLKHTLVGECREETVWGFSTSAEGRTMMLHAFTHDVAFIRPDVALFTRTLNSFTMALHSQ
jgi:hypothetical protein